MSELALNRIAPRSIAPMVDIQSIIEKAIDAKSAVEVIERLEAMHRRMREDQAKAQFDEAMSAFQSECPPVTKTKCVDNKYSYAPLEIIEAVIRPLCRKHGFSHTFDTDTTSAEGWVIAKCIVTHSAGHCRESVAKFPLGTKTNLMSNTQQYAAALTFANRRSLMNAYGVVVCGEDLDGQVERQKPRGPSSMEPAREDLKPLALELWKLLTPVRGNERNWNVANQWLWQQEVLDGAIPERAEEISTAAKFRAVIEKVREVLK